MPAAGWPALYRSTVARVRLSQAARLAVEPEVEPEPAIDPRYDQLVGEIDDDTDQEPPEASQAQQEASGDAPFGYYEKPCPVCDGLLAKTGKRGKPPACHEGCREEYNEMLKARKAASEEDSDA